MIKKILITTAICFINIALFAQVEKSILVTTEWLSKRLNDNNIKIFHVDNEKAYIENHIPTAQFLSHEEYTFEDSTHAFDLPTVEKLQQLFERKGVSNDDIIVLYVASNWIPMMSRVYLTLDYLGLADNTYLLDGGLALWKAEGRATSTEVPKVEKSTLNIDVNNGLLATVDYVKLALDNPDINIVDGRASVFYQGIQAGNGGKSRKGRIPGAKTIPFTDLYQKNGNGSFTFLPQPELEIIFKGQNLDKEKQIILYCHIGMQLSVVYVMAKHLGYKDVKIYDGSFYEWGPDQSLPIELDSE